MMSLSLSDGEGVTSPGSLETGLSLMTGADFLVFLVLLFWCGEGQNVISGFPNPFLSGNFLGQQLNKTYLKLK